MSAAASTTWADPSASRQPWREPSIAARAASAAAGSRPRRSTAKLWKCEAVAKASAEPRERASSTAAASATSAIWRSSASVSAAVAR